MDILCDVYTVCLSIKLYWQDVDGDLRTRGVGQDVGVASAFNGVA